MDHPNVTSWDAVEVQAARGVRHRDLGRAAGAFRAAAALVEIAPGERLTPAAAHAGFEELSYLLDGDGLASWDGRAAAIGAGDVLLHRAGAPVHALLAGERGLTLVAFGPRQLPLIDDDAPEAPATSARADAERPPEITALEDVPPSEFHRGPVRQKIRFASRMMGAETTGMRHVRIAPGARGTPHHCHGAEEELFVVLGGAGTVRLGEERFPVARRSVVARPPGTGVAHSFVAGEQGLELLGWGTREPNDIAYYPDSNKVYLCGVGVIGRIEPCDYWDGEE
jgi:uncharacterized cupin superfamily protein